MNNLVRLKKSKSINDVANLLGFQPKALAYVIYKIPEDKKYYSFKIPKKNGGDREINAPIPQLKKVQSRLEKILFNCTEEILAHDEQYKHQYQYMRRRARKAISHGFKKGLSITSNAELHINRKYVLNIDLENFFPSINFGRVRGYFLKNKHFQLDPKVATVLAQIACYKNGLPQGSPCSPIISNMITQTLDVRLVKLAKEYKCTYSRYADDLTISTNQKVFPNALAALNNNSLTVGAKLHQCINRAGFNIKNSKTRLQIYQSRQMVTGLVVNKHLNVRSDYYRRARSMCNEFFRKGTYFTKKNNGNTLSTTSHLNGILNHIYHIKNYKNRYAQEGYRKHRHDGYLSPKQDHEKGKYPPLNRCNQYSDESHKVAIDGIKNLYSKFVFFKNFYLIEKPLIFCEGPTDNIYLRCALKQLAASYPNLIGISSTQKSLKVNFFNRTEINNEMLKLAEGASGLKFIALGYERWMKRYTCTGKKHPVVMIVDNDKGGNEVILPFAKTSRKIKPNIYYITENLYIIQIPKIKNMDTELEDYFEPSTLSEVINSKTFNRKTTFDTQKYYGKSIFAKTIVQKKQATINFDKFKDILDLVEFVIADYKLVMPSSQVNSTTQSQL